MDLQPTSYCTANTINIEWQRQRGQFNNYIVKYRIKDSQAGFESKQTSENNLQISNLKNGTLYEIKIFVEDGDGDESLTFKTELRTVASIASKLLETAAKLCNESVAYRLYPVKIANPVEGLQIREFFSDTNDREERSLLLFGASGSGKSTLVDAITNYVTDVSFADNFRFKITGEENTTSKQERAEDIVCYKLRCENGFKIRYNLNVVDVPGFGSGAIDNIYEKILSLFQSDQYVGHIGAVCLVVQSFCRLTEENKGIFNNILSIFGNDLNYIIPIITFDDGGEIKALSALKAAGVPFMEHNHFRFNNSQLLTGDEHVDIWNRRQNTMHDLFGEPTIFIEFPLEKTRGVLKNQITPTKYFVDTKPRRVSIEQNYSEQRTRSQQSNTRSQQINTRSQQINTRSQQINTRSQQSITMSQQSNTRTQQSNTMSQQGKTMSQQDKTMSQQGQTMSQQGQTMSQQGKTMSQPSDTSDTTTYSSGKICINCTMCKQTCVLDCSISVRFFWYIAILFEKIWSFFCCIFSSCRCCSRRRCVCKLPDCCCIKCLHRCLGCTCSCSFDHHNKEIGSYRENERDNLTNVSRDDDPIQ